MTTLTVIQQSGQSAAPDARQTQLLQAAQKVIEASPEFAALPHQAAAGLGGAAQAGAASPTSAPVTLSRAEINAGLTETQKGYLYLRYDVAGQTPQEFWAHVANTSKLNWKSGQVSVELPAAAVPATP